MASAAISTADTVRRMPGAAAPRHRATGCALVENSRTHALTVDLEDWGVAVMGPDRPVTDRVVRNTHVVLDLLASHGIRATFFVLGRVAEAFPSLIRTVHAEGHEIASHGYGHESLGRLTPQLFREDVSRSAAVLADVVGERPVGYRAPAFSIVDSTRWAGPIMAELGFRYSSSIFPFRGSRYGIADEPPGIHRWRECDLIEVPPATVVALGRRWPVAGGGYFRLLPGAVVRAAVRRAQRERRSFVAYLHPYELDPPEMVDLRAAGWHIPWKRRVTQAMFRTRMYRRLAALLKAHRFAPIRDVIADWL